MYLLIIGIMLMISAVLYYRLSRTLGFTREPATGNKKDAKRVSEEATTDDKSKFCGFVIEPGDDCCQASSELTKITFSCRDTIALPLPVCDKEVCTCKRKMIRERRTWNRRQGSDRRTEIRFRFSADAEDRRIGKGRRQQDKIWSGGYAQ